MNRIAATATAGISILGIALTSVAVAPAASAGVERERRGMTAAGTEWEVQLERERGRIEYSIDIDSRERGERWTITVKRNGSKVFREVRTTDNEGEIEIDRVVRNRPGVVDRFVVRAVSEDGDVVRTTLKV
jgi:hypothetical protein